MFVKFCSPLFLFFLPGYVTLRALKLKGLDRAEALFLSVFSSILLTSWLGLLLAEIALFSLGSLLLLLLIYSVSMAVVFRVRPSWGKLPRPRLDIGYWLLVIVVVAALFFFRPFESILGTSDSGVYLGMGVNIARTGAIRARDPLLTDLTGGIENDLLYSYRFPYGSELMRFFGDGVRIWDMEQGMLFSQQNHLYQVWIAIFYSIFGIPVFLYVTPLFGLLGVIGLYFVGKALFDDRVGLLASFLLAINVVQIWFSRWAMSEVLTQLLVFGALYCFILYVKTAQHVATHPLSPDSFGYAQDRRQIQRPGLDGSAALTTGLALVLSPAEGIQAERGGQSAQRYFGLLAGFGLGLAVLSRADGIFLIVPVALYFVYLRFTRKLCSQHLYFFVPFAALLLHWLIHSLLFSRGQALAISRALPYFSSIGPLAVGGAALIAILLILAFLSYRRFISALARLSTFGKWIRPAVAVLIVLLALYAYFIRPSTADPEMVYYHPAGGIIRTYNEENLVRLGWYVTPLGLLLAVGGLIAMISKETDESVIFFLGVAMLYSFVFLHSALVNPIHVYWIRRYITVVIPAIMLFISYGLSQIPNPKSQIPNSSSRIRGVLASVLAIALAASFLRTSLALAGQVPYQGAVAQMNRFAEQLSDRATVIFESPLIGDPFALPLTYLYGRDSFVLQGQGPNSEQFADLVGRWRERGREVFYIACDGLTRVRSDDYIFSPVGEVALDIPVPETSFDHLPKGIVHHPYDLEIYKIEPTWKAGVPIYPFSLDVGRFDYGYLMSGFHAREGSPGGWYRWTGKTAEILLPWIPIYQSTNLPIYQSTNLPAYQLSLAVGSPRPEGIEPAKVTLYLNGLLLDQFDLGDEFKTHTVVIPADFITDPQARTALLRLETNPWIPAEAGLEDVRELGIILDRVELDRAP